MSDPSAPEVPPPTPPEAALDFTLSTYFPPSEANGGGRRTTSATKIRSLGMEPSAITALGNYARALPWEGYFTGVSGYKASNKAALGKLSCNSSAARSSHSRTCPPGISTCRR